MKVKIADKNHCNTMLKVCMTRFGAESHTHMHTHKRILMCGYVCTFVYICICIYTTHIILKSINRLRTLHSDRCRPRICVTLASIPGALKQTRQIKHIRYDRRLLLMKSNFGLLPRPTTVNKYIYFSVTSIPISYT